MSDSQKELQAGEGGSPFHRVWLETTMGVKFDLPDMLKEHVDSVCRQLDGGIDRIMLMNVSEVVMVVPRRILQRAGVGDRCFWEV